MNGIEKELERTGRVIKLDIASEMGKEAAGRYGVSSVPTTLVLGPGGQIVHRDSGLPDRDEVVARARAA